WNLPVETRAAEKPARALPAVAAGWSIELVEEAPRVLYPTAIVQAADGTLYLGSDPMDMPGPPTAPIDRVVAIQGGRITTFADKGLPRGVGRGGPTMQRFGGGVIRIRPDGTGLEVVSTGERNPLSVALSATDEVFSYGNDDDSKQWPNSLTHHIVGGHYGYP